MSDWYNINSRSRSDSYIEAHGDITIYEETIFYKLNTHFDKFVERIGGIGRAILFLMGVFAVIVTLIAITGYIRQQRRQFVFGGNTFRLESMQARNHMMTLRDQDGNILTFSHTDPGGPARAWTETFVVAYMDVTFSVVRNFRRHNYTFSDGSSATNSRSQSSNVFSGNHGEFPVGQVPHFTDMQQAESIALDMFRAFYMDWTATYIFVLVVLGSLVVWLFCLLTSFYREDIHDITRPLQRVWAAELEDMRLARLDGKVSVAILIAEFLVVLIIAIIAMRLL